jgi:hypothetical protein
MKNLERKSYNLMDHKNYQPSANNKISTLNIKQISGLNPIPGGLWLLLV